MKRAVVGVMLLILPSTALAYPEFEKAIEGWSGRNVNCAYCHAHPDGPDGVKAGQIGSLDPTELRALNKARTAFEPGAGIDSPILNAFGDHLINALGKKQVMLLQKDTEKLPSMLGTHDMDQDGIPDAEELRDGTHPLVKHHGDPWKLLAINLRMYGFHLLMLVLATFAGVFGINHMIRWFGIEAERALGKGDE